MVRIENQRLLVRSQAKDSRKAKVEQGEFDEELSEQEGRLSLWTDCWFREHS
jgi:hypothetical protein